MALHHQLPIHKAGTDLLGLVATIHAQMPRGFKRTIGDKLMAHSAEMLDLMAMANASRGEERKYGLDGEEAIEMAYENVLNEARSAIKGLRRPDLPAALSASAGGEGGKR